MILSIQARCYRQYRLQGWNREAARILVTRRTTSELELSLKMFQLAGRIR